jgi:colanic acid biosynthesis glycosyl transferase WcaI
VKFGILSQYYPPEIGAPQARLSSLGAALVKRGHSVVVLTAMPNYPMGRIHSGYSGLVRRERRDHIDVIRTSIYPSQSAATVPRLTSYLSFVASSWAIGSMVMPSVDYLLTESPPLFLGTSGAWLSWIKRARFIFNVSDLWPQTAVHLGVLNVKDAAYRAASALEAFCYRRAWLVTGQSKTIVADISARFPDIRTFHLSNGVDTERFGSDRRDAELRRSLLDGRDTVVLYAGLHGLAQGLDQIIEAATALKNDPGLRFVFAGDGPKKSELVTAAARRALDNVAFLEPRPFADMPALLASADILIVSLKTDIPGAVPSKLYEAMASGRAIVLVAAGEAADLVRDHAAGVVVPPGDIAALVSAISDLRANPMTAQEFGMRARRVAEAYFDRSAICGRFIDYLELHARERPATS